MRELNQYDGDECHDDFVAKLLSSAQLVTCWLCHLLFSDSFVLERIQRMEFFESDLIFSNFCVCGTLRNVNILRAGAIIRLSSSLVFISTSHVVRYLFISSVRI